MDRFIEQNNLPFYDKFSNLKSNMDRFIDMIGMCGYVYSEYLKSNMDRFIVSSSSSLNTPTFI